MDGLVFFLHECRFLSYPDKAWVTSLVMAF
jgi:hypothetical protein